MMNKEWLEVKLTQTQIDILEQSNIISDGHTSYVIELGKFYKISYSDDPHLQKYYITTNVELLPKIVLEGYKEIIEIIYNKLNNKDDNNK